MIKKRSWYPHVTVATVIEHEGRFLLVSEYDSGRLVYNQPAGHLEAGETILEAALRETLEETGYECTLTHSLGIRHTVSSAGITYIRHSFSAQLGSKVSEELDSDIEAVHWLSPRDCLAGDIQFRSPMVMVDINAHLEKSWHTLDLYKEHRCVHVNDGTG